MSRFRFRLWWLPSQRPSVGRGRPGDLRSRRPRLEQLEDRLTLSTAPPLLEGPAAGADSQIVTTAGDWSVVPNDSWLHSNSSGTGNGLATFAFDANTGATRTGTLTIAGQTLTVTQAGSDYMAANPVVNLVPERLRCPSGVAVVTQEIRLPWGSFINLIRS